MSNSKGIEQNNEYGITSYDPSQFAISNGILTKYLGHNSIVEVPNIVEQISSSAFMGCAEVTEIIIPDAVKKIDRYSFVSCTALKTVRIGFGVSVIPMGAFAELPNLESVIVTDSISEIEDFAFRNCKNLGSLEFLTKKYRDPVTAVEKGKAFEMMLAGKPAKIEYTDLLDCVPILANIGNYAFFGCLSLDVSSFKDSAERIGISAFDNCFSEIHSNNEPDIEAESESGMYSPEDDTYIENNDDIEIAPSDIESDEEDYSEDEIDEKEESGYEPQTDEVSTDDQNIAEPVEDNEEIREEFLVSGFIVVNNEIQNEVSQRTIPDAPIESLSLSTRSYNALYRIKEKITEARHERVMVSDLLKLSPEQLLQVRNMGAKSAEEIIERISTYLYSDMSDEEKTGTNKQYTIAPDYEVIDGVITHIDSGHIVEDVFIDYIGLGVRATNSLHRGQILKLSELICLSAQQLKGFPNMGAKSVSEILETIPRYLKANRVEELQLVASEEEQNVPIKVSIPPLSMEYAVLASDYAVVDGVIYHRKTLKVIPDLSIERLNLSVRSLNCLVRNGNTRVSTLIGMPFGDFRSIRNLGQLSANEIQEKLEQYLDAAHENAEKQALPASTVSAEQVLAVMHKHEFEFVGLDIILQELPDATEEDVREVLTRLAESKKIVQNEDEFAIHHPSFFETVNALSPNNSSQLDERAIRILQQRASGKTLEEVGQQEGATRERIRQIEKKALDKFTRRGHIIYEEDQYAYLFSTYAFEREFYFDYLDESKNIWYYLNFRYTRGKTDTSEALDDEKLSIATRRAIDKYIHRGYIQIDGSYIPMQRGDFEDIVAEKYCKDEVTLEKFFEYYEQFLAENEITDDRLQLSESAKASRSNRLAESNKILWKQNRCLRYYDIDGSDFTELLETLNLGQYENIELSTRKFLIDYPDLMKRYDLRDEYEIHNLLKKIHAEKENPQMVFGRMPSLQFGVFDKDSAVKEILFAMAPVSLDDLAEMISLEYGTREDTIKANWLNCISEYYHHGMYSVEYEDMPEEHVQKLKEVLVNDFYFMTELRRIYKNLVDDADLSLLSTYNLKKMGFLVGSTYVIQNYSTAEAYFDQLLTTDDVVDVAPISRRYTGLTTYSAYLAGIKHDMRIIEFEPYQYINIRRLEKLGFTKEKLREYGSQVWSYLVDDRYFTIQSIRNDGFESDLDVLGFGDLFYASILKEDGRFSWQRVGNAVVLSPKGNSFTSINGKRVTNLDTFGLKTCKASIVEIPGSIKNLAGHLGYQNENIQTVIVGEGVETIGESCFSFVKNLKTVKVSRSVISVGDTAFKYTPWYEAQDDLIIIGSVLTEMKQDHAVLNVPQGIKTVGRLVAVFKSALRKVVLPESVTTLCESAFSGRGNENIKEFIFTDSLINIGLHSFGFNKWTESFGDNPVIINNQLYQFKVSGSQVVIPDGVTKICDEVFKENKDIKSVVFPKTLKSIGELAFGECQNLTSISLPEGMERLEKACFYNCRKLNKVSLPDSLAIIGRSAFNSCPALTEITLGDSVEVIGEKAFVDCRMLRSFTMNDKVRIIGNEAFKNCVALQRIELPDSVVEIGSDAFSGCASLDEIIVPGDVKKIGSSAFNGCKALKTVSLGSVIEEIADSAFAGCNLIEEIILPKTVGQQAFKGCSGLKKISFNSEMTVIDKNTFNGCTSLIDIVIPDAVTEIREGAFSGCTNLRSVTLPTGLALIGKSAFSGCTALENISIPATVKTLEDNAFKDCTSLSEVAMSDSIENFGLDVFTNSPYMKKEFGDFVIMGGILSKYLGAEKDVIVPDNVTTIGENAFAEAYHVETITIPDTVKTIANKLLGTIYSWGDNPKPQLKKVVIGNGVTSIGDEAFASCEKLTEVVFGTGLSSIGQRAFSGCKELKSIDLSKTALTEINQEAFNGCWNAKKVILPDNIEIIGRSAFAGISLGVVQLPKSVKKVERSAFDGASELIVYDTIDPDAVEANEWKHDKWNGSVNSPLACAMLGVPQSYVECQGNTRWRGYHITVLSANSGDVRYRIFCDSEERDDYRAMMFSAWGKNASFTFDAYDDYFMKTRNMLGRAEMAFCRIQYPEGLSTGHRANYEAYLERCMYIERSAKRTAEIIGNEDAVERLAILDRYKAIDDHNIGWIKEIMKSKKAKKCQAYLDEHYSM